MASSVGAVGAVSKRLENVTACTYVSPGIGFSHYSHPSWILDQVGVVLPPGAASLCSFDARFGTN